MRAGKPHPGALERTELSSVMGSGREGDVRDEVAFGRLRKHLGFV
jgi:hypothetical protein